jgi:K+-transporting ATPase KdpF subunit
VSVFEEGIVNLDYLLGGALALALTVYLVYALLAPEKF